MRDRVERIEPGFASSLAAREPLRWRLQAPVSAAIGALARLKVRLFPRRGICPYLEGAYVPDGYAADPAAVPPLEAPEPAGPAGGRSDDRPAR